MSSNLLSIKTCAAATYSITIAKQLSGMIVTNNSYDMVHFFIFDQKLSKEKMLRYAW